jgi:hypothetical protein
VLLPEVTFPRPDFAASDAEAQSNQRNPDLAPILRFTCPVTNSMSASTAEPIRLDHATLRSEAAGTHTRYTVSLTRRPDEAWYGAYAAVCDGPGLLRTFPIDRGRGTISFSCRVVEGPTHVIEMLEKLEEVLTSVERRLGSWQTARSTDSGPMKVVSAS